jgi:putative addiction module component (TIGR02574 family)
MIQAFQNVINSMMTILYVTASFIQKEISKMITWKTIVHWFWKKSLWKRGWGNAIALKRILKEKYMTIADNILKEALNLTPSEKAQLIDKLIASLDKPDKEIDELWAEEAEDRLDAYDQGRIKAISLERVLQKYR